VKEKKNYKNAEKRKEDSDCAEFPDTVSFPHVVIY
jgi:hypothetical protein